MNTILRSKIISYLVFNELQDQDGHLHGGVVLAVHLGHGDDKVLGDHVLGHHEHHTEVYEHDGHHLLDVEAPECLHLTALRKDPLSVETSVFVSA